jgi:two-component system chemotaxis response regulator CheY
MVTTEAEKSRVIEAIKTGANDYLIKPFSPDQLAAKVKSVLGVPTA